MLNPFSGIGSSVEPECYSVNDYEKDLMAIAKIFKTELKELPEEMATEAEDVEEEVTPPLILVTIV
jgi:hypothetical protein